MRKVHIQKVSIAAVFVAIGVVLSPLSIPIGTSRCFPIQHLINILGAVFLGPLYSVLCAFATSTIRVLMGTGTLLAFPGSMIGAFLCAIFYKKTKKIWTGFLGEIIGTGILGALAAYPVSVLLLGREAALFAMVLPFSVSSVGGACMGAVLVYAIKRTGLLTRWQQALTTKKPVQSPESK